MTYQIKEIPGAPGYKVDTNGKVFSHYELKRNAKTGRLESHLSNKLRELKQSKHLFGYPDITINNKGTPIRTEVHRLVLLTFVGPLPKGMQSCHNNGDPSDCRLENLRYDTPKGNQADKTLHGTLLVGEKHPSAKLTDTQVKRIRLMREIMPKLRQKDIGHMFGVCQTEISHILLDQIRKSNTHA